jgi:hypothetical protein
MFFRISAWTMPAPRISIQPSFLHTPASRSAIEKLSIAMSTPGSTKRKVAAEANLPVLAESASRLEERALECASVSPSSTAEISICWIIHSCVGSVASFR